MYPEGSLQGFIAPENWWEPAEGVGYERGRLIWVFLPHVDQQPFIAIPMGRSEPTLHREATVKFVPLDVRQAIRYPNLPVAALPQFEGERWGVYRVKKRPALIIGWGSGKIDKSLTAGKSKWQTSRTVIVAPYYGVDEGARRSGFNSAFIDRIRRCEYPQYMWDKLPIKGATESILRLDHLQPVGRNRDTIEFTPYRLGAKAMILMEEWVDWIIKNELAFGGEEPRLGDIREFLLEF